MEYIEDKEQEVLKITEDIRSYIYETAKWANFLSVVGFVLTAFMIMFAFGVGSFITAMNNILGGEANNPYAALGTGVLTVICLLVALIYFYPSLLLFKYANAAKQAVLYADQATLAVAMSKMKSFFKFWGILTIVFLTFYVLSILITIVASIGTVNVAP
jgi:hypothetical protein